MGTSLSWGLSRAQVPARSRAAGWSVQPPLRTASVTCADSWGPGSCHCHGSWGASGIWNEERPGRGGAASWEAGLDGRLGRRLQTEAAKSLVPLRGAVLGGRSCFQPACSVFAAWRQHSLSPASSGSVNSCLCPPPPLSSRAARVPLLADRDSRVVFALGGRLRWPREAPVCFRNRHAFHPPPPSSSSRSVFTFLGARGAQRRGGFPRVAPTWVTKLPAVHVPWAGGLAWQGPGGGPASSWRRLCGLGCRRGSGLHPLHPTSRPGREDRPRARPPGGGAL